MRIISQIDYRAEADDLLKTLQDRQISCIKCDTVYAPETFNDIRVRDFPKPSAFLYCPVCPESFEVFAHPLTLKEVARNHEY